MERPNLVIITAAALPSLDLIAICRRTVREIEALCCGEAQMNKCQVKWECVTYMYRSESDDCPPYNTTSAQEGCHNIARFSSQHRYRGLYHKNELAAK